MLHPTQHPRPDLYTCPRHHSSRDPHCTLCSLTGSLNRRLQHLQSRWVLYAQWLECEVQLLREADDLHRREARELREMLAEFICAPKDAS